MFSWGTPKFSLDFSSCAQLQNVNNELLSQLTLVLSMAFELLLFIIFHMYLQYLWLQLYEHIAYVHGFSRSQDSSVCIAMG
jgi:hypothetical protein